MPIWSADYLFSPDGSIAQAVAKAKKERSMTPTPDAPKAAAPAVAEAPPEWTVRRSVDGLQVVIDSANFEHDALLILTGDFEDESTKLSYAGALADKLNGRLAAAPQQVAAWMPIQTAPKDGTHVLTWWAGAARVGWVQGAGQSRDGGDWWNTHERVAMAAGEARPTHWMPLPAPPSQASATGEV